MKTSTESGSYKVKRKLNTTNLNLQNAFNYFRSHSTLISNKQVSK